MAAHAAANSHSEKDGDKKYLPKAVTTGARWLLIGFAVLTLVGFLVVPLLAHKSRIAGNGTDNMAPQSSTVPMVKEVHEDDSIGPAFDGEFHEFTVGTEGKSVSMIAPQGTVICWGGEFTSDNVIKLFWAQGDSLTGSPRVWSPSDAQTVVSRWLIKTKSGTALVTHNRCY